MSLLRWALAILCAVLAVVVALFTLIASGILMLTVIGIPFAIMLFIGGMGVSAGLLSILFNKVTGLSRPS